MAIRVQRPFDEVAALPPEVFATYLQVLEDEEEEQRKAEKG